MAYTLLGLRSAVQDELKDSSYSSSVIDRALNAVQRSISRRYHWKFMEKDIQGALTIGEFTYEQQSDHQTTLRLILTDDQDTDNVWDITDRYMDSGKFFELFPDPSIQGDAQPHCWTEFKDQLYFNCPADQAYLLTQHYLKVPTTLTNDADVPDLPIDFEEALILGATSRCERIRGNYDYSRILKQEYEEDLLDLVNRVGNRQSAVIQQAKTGRSLRTDEWGK